MIITRLQGGMGNQMFQYAVGRALSLKNKVPLGLDVNFLVNYKPNPFFTQRDYSLDVFNIEATIVSRKDIPFLYRKYKFGVFTRYIYYIRRKILSTPGKEKNDYRFDSSILNLGVNTYLEGWWHSPKYFAGIENIIRKDFTLKNEPSENIKNLMKEIKENNSLGIHIRRGDYVGNKDHEIVDNEYYERGIEIINKQTKINKIYVFSDDIEWCKENMKFEFPTMFVGEEYVGKKSEGHLVLMSSCKYFIIPNSTFSWWGAWLSDYENKIVICPKQWFGDITINTNDLIPNNWIRI